jgi:hypothetical protein
MKRLFLFLAVLSFGYSGAQSVTEEWGVDLFFSGYQGEIVSSYSPDVIIKEMRPGLGVLYRWNIRNKLAIGIEGKFVQLHASDANHTSDARDLEFNTTILEADAAVYYRFSELGSGWGKNHWAPYIGAGGGIMYVSPEVTYTGAPPQGLDQSEHTSTNAFYELGITHQTNNYKRISLYWRHHKTFTDYLDGFGPSGSDSDWYYSIGITFTGLFYRERETCYW